MKISTKGRYGLRAMIDLAMNSEGESITLKSIADRQGISETYLEQLIPSLRKAGLVKSVRGAQGGYLLAKEPKDISVGQILRALEGSMAPVACVEDHSLCDGNNACVSRIVWERIQQGINNAIDSISLLDLIAENKEENNKGRCNL
jgi:Rrf2 family protein